MGRAGIGEFEQLVLLAIARLDGSAYAVSIVEEIERTAHRAVGQASIYVVLSRLEAKGLVTSALGEPSAERGGRARRYYVVTEQAIEQLRASRAALVRMWNGVEALVE